MPEVRRHARAIIRRSQGSRRHRRYLKQQKAQRKRAARSYLDNYKGMF